MIPIHAPTASETATVTATRIMAATTGLNALRFTRSFIIAITDYLIIAFTAIFKCSESELLITDLCDQT